MRRNVPVIFVLLLSSAAAVFLPKLWAQSGPAFEVALGQPAAPLDGPWQFHTGDNLAWATPGFDDSSWQELQAGVPWDAQGHWGYTGFAWYRRHISFTPGTPRDLDLSLFLPTVDSACEVYWNGRLVGGIGRVPPHPVWYQGLYPGEVMLVGKSVAGIPLGKPQPGILAIRVWKAPTILFASAEEGGLMVVPEIGSASAVAALETGVRFRWLQENQFALAVMFLSTVVSAFALLMGLRNGGNTFLFWLSLALAFPLEDFLLRQVPGLVPFRWGYGFIGEIIGIYDVALWFVLIDLLGLKGNKRLVRWTIIVAAVELATDFLDGALQLFDWSKTSHSFLPWDFAFTILAPPAEFWGAVLVLFALRRRLDAARWMLAICTLAANLAQGLEDLGGMGARWTHWTLFDSIERPLFTLAGSPLNVKAITSTLLLIAILYAAWRYSVEQTQRQNALEQEYRNAQELQQLLVPESLPALPGYSMSSVYKPAMEVGGDFFQVIGLPTGETLVVLGDVSGKGLKAAMTVSLIVGTLRAFAETINDPAALLAVLNRRLHERLRGGFCTCITIRINPDGTCLIANAGHLPPYRNRQEIPLPPGLPLGIVPDAEYSSVSLQFVPGDTLTLLSDGVVEARNAQGDLFGFDRTREISGKSAVEIAQAAQQFGQQDDITVLTLHCAPAEVLHA